jgi:hypothetical protein
MAAKKKDKAPSTGLKKFFGQEAKKYDPPVKGSGKPKYQNVVKEARTDTKKNLKEDIKKGQYISKPSGVRPTKQEATRKAGSKPNVAKEIDRENKVRKGVRTEKPKTRKVPVKPRGGMRGGAMGGGGLINPKTR